VTAPNTISPLGPIGAARVFVTDVERATRFYRDALGLTAQFSGPDTAMFDTGPTKLLIEEVAPEDAESQQLVGRFTGLSFTVTDIGASVSGLASRGIGMESGPDKQDWGGILAHFRDPDGNVLTIVEYPPGA